MEKRRLKNLRVVKPKVDVSCSGGVTILAPNVLIFNGSTEDGY
jgi:hypothetical protein